MEACTNEKPDILVIEGTRINEESSSKEEDVEDEIINISTKAKGLSVCNWSVRDTDRMLSFSNAAKRMNKKLAISLRQAYLLEQLSACKESTAPSIDDDTIEIYANRKDWGLIGSKCDERMRNADYDKWEREYLDSAISFKDIRKDQDKYMFFCTNYDLKELIDIRPKPGSCYIKSVCEPFDVEMEIDWERVMNWINHFDLKDYSTHVSGHASGPQLKEFVQTVKPKLIVPIHTQHANFYEKWWSNVRLIDAIGDSLSF
jgi:ribonuclease J